MKRLKVLSDFDGTIVDILRDWCEELQCVGFVDCTPENIKVYDMAANPCLAGVTEKELMDTLSLVAYRLPAYTPWIAGAVEQLPKLAEQHDFTFVSCQPVDIRRQIANKQLRLRTILPGAVVNYHGLSSERLGMDADVFIDDRAEAVVEWSKRHPAGLGLLITAPHNTDAVLPYNARRVADWGAVAHFIEQEALREERGGVLFTEAAAAEAMTMVAEVAPHLTAPTELYPEDATARKRIPLYSGNLAYFPKAAIYLSQDLGAGFKDWLAMYSETKGPAALRQAWECLVRVHPQGREGLERDVAAVSWLGNEQHNPGQPLHWARGKSMDQLDAAARHWDEYSVGKRVDKAGYPIIGQAGWRVKAELQLRLETIEAATKAAKEIV